MRNLGLTRRVFLKYTKKQETRNKRGKCEDVAMAQFWVRNAGSRESVIWGKKELKGKKQNSCKRILHQMFHFRGSNCQGWSHLAG